MSKRRMNQNGSSSHRILPLFLLGAAFFCECSAGPSNKEIKSKNSIHKARFAMTKDVFGFKNQDYFENPMSKIEGIRDDLEQSNSDAILLGGPGFIPIDKTSKFPLASLRVTESLKAYSAPFKTYAIIAVMDLGSNTLIADYVVEQKFVKIARNPNATPPPPGKYSDGGALDLFARNIIPVSIGDFYSTILILGSRSNRVRTVIANAEFEHDSDKLNRSLEDISRNAKSANRNQQVIAPNKVGPEQNSPPIPDSVGISMKFSDQKIPGIGQPKPVLLLAFKLPAKPLQTAISFSLLATGSRTPSPLVWQIEVPVNTGGDSGPILEGQFSIDLDTLIGKHDEQIWYLYAFSGKEISASVSVDQRARPLGVGN
jgi:hypothetical protein